MAAYSMDLCTRVLRDCDAGTRSDAVAEKYRVSRADERLETMPLRLQDRGAPPRLFPRRDLARLPSPLLQAIHPVGGPDIRPPRASGRLCRRCCSAFPTSRLAAVPYNCF